MCAPRSERATAGWLKEKSALGGPLKHDFTLMPLMQLYRASDRLFKKKDLIEGKIFELGMRPVYHHKEDRCDGHLFITVLAYQAVQVICISKRNLARQFPRLLRTPANQLLYDPADF